MSAKQSVLLKAAIWIISSIGVGGVLLMLGFGLVFLLIMGMFVSQSGASIGVPPMPEQREINIPLTMLPIYLQAEQGQVPWSRLAAIHQVTTDFGERKPSSGNRVGFVGFPAELWHTYQKDGDGDGDTEAENPYDAIFSLAHYLGSSVGEPRQKLERFLPQPSDVDRVLGLERNFHTLLFIENGWLWPFPGSPVVSSPYGLRIDPLTGKETFHKGIDIPAAKGTPVLAVQGGTVTAVSSDPDGYGHFIRIDHGGGMQSVYAHLSQIVVEEDQRVSQGEWIGLVGSSGRSTGPHLHLEIREYGSTTDPYLKWKTDEECDGVAEIHLEQGADGFMIYLVLSATEPRPVGFRWGFHDAAALALDLAIKRNIPANNVFYKGRKLSDYM
ncbi:M23 family metallopeptidase [Paenibacillus chartarius]|uniref:M23 family metallopeptidase n=1 Tax=Paenibacillus chartarius TaxID=747481 RepID=A0ABV6DMG2_9BACL